MANLISKSFKDYNKNFYFENCGLENKYPHLSVSIRYYEGGTNWYYGKKEPKGYYIHIEPCSIKKGNGMLVIEGNPTSGYKDLVEAITRKSKKSFGNCLSEYEIGRFMAMCNAVGVSDSNALEIWEIIKQ